MRLTSRRGSLALFGAIVAYIALGLGADHYVDLTGQRVLGALTWAVLAAAMLALTPRFRLITLLVVVVATCGEILGSLVWGLYTYRLENVPSFVPPGHGLVFVAGFSLATAFTGREALLVRGAYAVLASWGIAGLTLLERPDVAGAIGCVALAYALRRTRRAMYAGVFMMVAFLELYGTAIGTWTWAPIVPGTGIPSGNPPSGVASGYVVFDVVAAALAVRVAASRLVVRFAPGLELRS